MLLLYPYKYTNPYNNNPTTNKYRQSTETPANDPYVFIENDKNFIEAVKNNHVRPNSLKIDHILLSGKFIYG